MRDVFSHFRTRNVLCYSALYQFPSFPSSSISGIPSLVCSELAKGSELNLQPAARSPEPHGPRSHVLWTNFTLAAFDFFFLTLLPL